MSIEKDIAIHAMSGVRNVLSYVEDKKHDGEKTNLEAYQNDPAGSVENVLSYAQNLEKTAFALDGDASILVSGVGCVPSSAALAFQMDHDRYYRESRMAKRSAPMYVDKKTGEIRSKQAIECFHVIQSFPRMDDLDPRLVHKLGVEYANRAFPGHKCLIATHMNTDNLHNHIVVCAYHGSELRKFHMNKTSRRRIRHINDQISHEYGLPILIESDLNRNSTMSYAEWDAGRNGDLWKDRYRNDIRNVASIAHNWNEFVTIMRQAGYQIDDSRKYVTYRFLKPDPDDTRDYRLIRDKTLGLDFTREALTREYDWNSPDQTHTHHVQRKVVKKMPDLSISRYSPTGRRRSDLEMIFLFAIRIIQYFRDWFFDKIGFERTPDDPVYQPYQKRLQLMQNAAFAVQELGLENEDQLKACMNQVGAKLSHVRKELENARLNPDYEIIKAQEKELSREYHELKQIECGLNLANNPAFTHGPLFTAEELAPMQKPTIEKMEIREEKEPKIEPAPVLQPAPPTKQKQKNLWDGLDDSFTLL
ncbi:MAG: relaxase/mobilization nuclease domain-containing protein [Lachnospiraceae bacterium]|nr:relaxase/mobilization nuclease domain-containing protein [Lachnospiraceae bacterium]